MYQNIINYETIPHHFINYNEFPSNIHDFQNTIFYGPCNSGKYTQILNCIKRYSPTKLKYEKKMTIECNDNVYKFKISDIHYEIDMQMLGCNARLIWNVVFNNILDIIETKADKVGIIVCTNFHNIHSELLDHFHSYIQINNSVTLKYIISTEHISFIPDNILNRCYILSIPLPKKYLTDKSKKTIVNDMYHKKICDILLDTIIHKNNINTIRDSLYDILIYGFDVTTCIWYIISYLIQHEQLKDNDVNDVMLETYNFLQYYNNNYRPIFHLESIIFYLIIKIHGH